MSDTEDLILRFQKKLLDFNQDAHQILGIHEGASKSRVIVLRRDSYKRLQKLSIKQQALFEESLGCAEAGHFRSAIILAWVGFMSFVLDKVDAHGLQNLAKQGSSWNHKTIEEVSEKHADYRIFEALRDTGLFTGKETTAFHGLLSRRNECAHPSSHTPDANQALGYISEIFSRIEQVQKKYP